MKEGARHILPRARLLGLRLDRVRVRDRDRVSAWFYWYLVVEEYAGCDYGRLLGLDAVGRRRELLLEAGELLCTVRVRARVRVRVRVLERVWVWSYRGYS